MERMSSLASGDQANLRANKQCRANNMASSCDWSEPVSLQERRGVGGFARSLSAFGHTWRRRLPLVGACNCEARGWRMRAPGLFR